MRVLIAEDESIIRLDLKGMLEAAGLEVCAEARDGEEAVRLVRQTEPDVALLDVKMPRLDGIEAARQILEERPLPIVMVTAYGEQELVSRAVEAGVFGYLVKPFRETDLLPAIETARARHAELVSLAGGGGLPRGGARRPEGDRACEGDPHGARGAHRAGGVRAAPEGEPDLGPAAQDRRRGAHRNARSRRRGLGRRLAARLTALRREQPVRLAAAVEPVAEPGGERDEEERRRHDEDRERDDSLPDEGVHRAVERAIEP